MPDSNAWYNEKCNLTHDILVRLLGVVAQIADESPGIGVRREAAIRAVAELVGADAGTWAWGRGWPDSSSVAPVAVLPFGVTPDQMSLLMQWGNDPETDRTYRKPVCARMRATGSVTTIRHDLFSDLEWDAMPFMRTQLEKGGWSSWLNSAFYSDRDTWNSLFLLRDAGSLEFSRIDADIVHLAMIGLPWLRTCAEEVVPPETFVGLTARQRTVMLMILDGLPRKQVAHRLNIAEDTVGDHLKAIYAHFGVSSASELAALFLRSR